MLHRGVICGKNNDVNSVKAKFLARYMLYCHCGIVWEVMSLNDKRGTLIALSTIILRETTAEGV